jgi:cytochrome P450
MQDFAYLLPVKVICELIGIPEADREGFRPLARDVAGVFELHDLMALPAINAAAVRDGSVSAPAFVEEVLRFDSPVQLTSRHGYQRRLGSVAVSAATGIIALLGAGNRDPRRFADPARFDPLRTDGGSLSFGGGAHFCVGAALARLEGAVAFPRLLRRFPRIAAAAEPVRRDTLVLRGFDALPVTLT